MVVVAVAERLSVKDVVPDGVRDADAVKLLDSLVLRDMVEEGDCDKEKLGVAVGGGVIVMEILPLKLAL